jgi:hypothetical protein
MATVAIKPNANTLILDYFRSADHSNSSRSCRRQRRGCLWVVGLGRGTGDCSNTITCTWVMSPWSRHLSWDREIDIGSSTRGRQLPMVALTILPQYICLTWCCLSWQQLYPSCFDEHSASASVLWSSWTGRISHTQTPFGDWWLCSVARKEIISTNKTRYFNYCIFLWAISIWLLLLKAFFFFFFSNKK